LRRVGDLWIDEVGASAGRGDSAAALNERELAVFRVLAGAAPRVVSRHELARRAGLGELSPRRCDSLLVGIRRQLGSDAALTVRGRGWRCAHPVRVVGAVDAEQTGLGA
jgi:DNA-binding winged helix-turn-helix (wHTH) protein